MDSPRLGLLAGLVLGLLGCGGNSASNPGQDHPDASEAGAGATTAAGEAGAGGTCTQTPRTDQDDERNATTLEMVSLAAPATPAPLYIALIEVQGATGAPKAEKQRLFDPYQAAVEERLSELGATNISRFWTSNALSATLQARHVSQILCWPNVVSVDVDAPYWTIAVPPWGPSEAGDTECPLADGACPEHCVELTALPYSGEAGSGCFTGREVVACSRTPIEVDDAAPACLEHVPTGKPYAFTVEPLPAEPDFLGWRECEGLTPVLCDTEG